MRIREITFHNFRSFRGEKRISFVDPLTDSVRPITVIAGTNGTGKSTILDAMWTLLKLTIGLEEKIISEVLHTGLVNMSVEIDPADLLHRKTDEPSRTLHIIVGRRSLARQSATNKQPNRFAHLSQLELSAPNLDISSKLVDSLRSATWLMHQDPTQLHGGMLYMPHDRYVPKLNGGPIQEPPTEQPADLWAFRFSPADRWEGSLEQFWVWQNYLDLEQGVSHTNLKPFVATLESMFGDERPITVRSGRAMIPAPYRNNGDVPLVRLDQLPSGEQQLMLLFGELARRRRPGVVIAIDEPELSLHPSLQRLVVHQLRQIAREWDAQIILATHSLEILHSVHKSEIIFLDHLAEVNPSPIELVSETIQ